MDNPNQLPERGQSNDDPLSSSSHPLLIPRNHQEPHPSSMMDKDKDDVEAPQINSEVHLAAEKGDVEGLKVLQSHGHLLTTNSKNRTPLHYACEFSVEENALEMADIILDSEWERTEELDSQHKLINHQDCQGDTALHLALNMGQEKLATKLLFLAADMNLKNHKGVKPIHLVHVKVPDALVAVFNTTLKFIPSDEATEENPIVRLDLGPIVGHSPCKNGNLAIETEMLARGFLPRGMLARVGSMSIILHPAVQLFLLLKRRKFRLLSWGSTLFTIAWLLLVIHFIWDVYRFQCPYQPGTLTPQMCDFHLRSRSLLFIRLQAWIILVMLVLHLPKELHDMCCSKLGMKYYCLQLPANILLNIAKWFMMALTIIVIMPGITTSDEPETIAITPLVYQSTYFAFLLACALIVEHLVDIVGLGVVTMVSRYAIPGVRNGIIGGFVAVTCVQLANSNSTARFTESLSSDFSIEFLSAYNYLILFIVFLVCFNLQIVFACGFEQFFGRFVPYHLACCQLREIYLIEKLILSERSQALLRYFGKKDWLLRFLVAQQNDTDQRMTVDVKVSEIPKALLKQVKILAAGNSAEAV